MWWLVFCGGVFAGFLLAVFVFAPLLSSTEDELRKHKARYGYSYHDLSAAWSRGHRGLPPTPPPPT